jgi:WD40 repeat protein
MCSLRAAVLSGLFLSSCFAAAPPAAPPPQWLKLIDRLGDDNPDVRKEAQKDLTNLGERILPVLRRAVRTHADVDVRLRAAVIASAIERKHSEVRRFDGHTRGVTFLALSPDGKRMVSSSQFDDFSRVWDVNTGKVLLQLKEHTKVAGVAWSKDGKHILTAGFDRKLILWDARTGKQVKTITDSPSRIYSVAFTPDGKKAVTGAEERTARIWDLETGKQTASNSDHGSGVRSVAVTPDGKTFVMRISSCCVIGIFPVINSTTANLSSPTTFYRLPLFAPLDFLAPPMVAEDTGFTHSLLQRHSSQPAEGKDYSIRKQKA